MTGCAHKPSERCLFAPWRLEQGYGDAIEQARIVPYVAAHCADATLAVRRPLVRLFSRLGFLVVALEDADVPTSSEVPSARLPRFDEMALSPLWIDESVRLPERDGRRRVGLCWRGSGGGRSAPDRDDDPRSVPATLLRPLLAVPGIEWIGLQHDPAVAAELPIPVLPDLVAEPDFADLGAVMRQCDLIVTIDTAVVHVAGTLGMPTWLLLIAPSHPMSDGGRWGRTPPLYPSVRQFRQPAPGDWSSVLTEVAATLAAADLSASVATRNSGGQRVNQCC